MQSRIQINRRRRTKSGGNTVLETAFTFLPLMAIIFGITDFGLMLYRWTTLENAVRQGSRYAVTFQTDSSGHQNTSIEDQVTTYGMGLVHTSDNPQTIFVNYYNPTTFALISSNGNQPGNIVQVSVQGVSFSWIAPLAGNYGLRNTNAFTINCYSSAILGAYPAGTSSVPE